MKIFLLILQDFTPSHRPNFFKNVDNFVSFYVSMTYLNINKVESYVELPLLMKIYI
jgi:hypothetical protein